MKNKRRKQRNKGRERDRWYRRTYGITLQQYDKMLKLQQGVCAVCRRPPKARRLSVDHKHDKNNPIVRGALCHRCNYRLLGRGLDNAELHRAAAVYLDSNFDGRLL